MGCCGGGSRSKTGAARRPNGPYSALMPNGDTLVYASAVDAVAAATKAWGKLGKTYPAEAVKPYKKPSATDKYTQAKPPAPVAPAPAPVPEPVAEPAVEPAAEPEPVVEDAPVVASEPEVEAAEEPTAPVKRGRPKKTED